MDIRLARVADAPAVQAIYRPIVQNTAISFEVVVPAITEIEQRITTTMTHWPWLVVTDRDDVKGYVYASQHRERFGYQWTTDISCYIHADWRGKGLGRALYTHLFALLVKQGYYTVCAGISLPNLASVRLHETMGMYLVGTYQHVGYKLGQWHDVGWWQGVLQPTIDSPLSPRPWFEVVAATTLADTL